MRVINTEADEILMNVCTSITKTKYYIVFNSGAERLLGTTYYRQGRFDRSKVISFFLAKGKVLNKDFKIDARGKCDDFNLAVFRLHRLIRKILYSVAEHTNEPLSNLYIQLWLGPADKSNFRYKSAIRQPYKAGRPSKPDIYPQLRNYIINTFGAKVFHGHEGDDALGIYKDIMCHCDKDIAQIPGDHYNFDKNHYYTVDYFGSLTLTPCGKYLKGTGILFFYAQMLMGDRTDNIPSIPHKRYKGYGAKTTYNVLKQCNTEREAFNAIVTIYQEIWPTDWMMYLKEQADLVWICREENKYGRDYIKEMLCLTQQR